MELKILDTDIHLICVPAKSFPDGIQAAFDELISFIGEDHSFYGVSRPGAGGVIVYKAAASVNRAEIYEWKHDLFTVKAGTYLATAITNWKQDETSVGRAFQQLLSDDRIDPQGACIEQYSDGMNDVVCMVRLADNKI